MSSAVPPASVQSLLRGIAVSRIGVGLALPSQYHGYACDILLRIALLPYLLPIKSERALAYELRERPELRAAVDLIASHSPTRATLWHFRRKNRAVYRIAMRRSLAVLLCDALALGISVPFSTPDDESGDPNLSTTDKFVDGKTGVSVSITPGDEGFSGNRRVANLDLFELEPGGPTLRARNLLYEDIGLPARAEFVHHGQRIVVLIGPPSWMRNPGHVEDYLTSLFGKRTSGPYTACNLIVPKIDRGTVFRDVILLSKRLSGSGIGHYTLPGGKKQIGESALACAKRELKEEVGLELLSAYPISSRWTKEAGYPEARSLGIFVAEYRGGVHHWNREHNAHSPWEWYHLGSLPSPLFFPTKMVLEDYGHSGPELKWADVDDSEPPMWSGREHD